MLKRVVNSAVAQKAKDHLKRNKDKYVTGSICFVAGGLLTHAVTKPVVRKLNVYNMYFNEQQDHDKLTKK